MKTTLTLLAAFIFSLSAAFAQSGTLTLYNNPEITNNNGRGDVATKIVANYKLYASGKNMLMDVTWDVTPTNYLFYGGKIYTRQQLGDDVFSQLTLSKIFVCEADAMYQGVNLGVVTFDCSGCGGAYAQSSTVNCTGKTIDVDVNGGKSIVFPARTFNEAKSIWVSGGIKFANFRFAKTPGANAPSLYTVDVVREAVKKLEGGNQSNANQKKEEQKTNISTNSGTGSSPNTANNKNTGEQIYNQTIENHTTIQQNTEKLNQQATNIGNTIGNIVKEQQLAERKAAEEREAKRKAKIANEYTEFKQRQNSEWDSYMNSASKVRTDRILNLQSQYDMYDEWVKTCKDGSKEALNAYVNGKKYTNDYYEIANLMLEAWHYGKTNPNKYIKLAIEEYNWTLTKFLLNAGANPDYISKNGLDRLASPIQRLLDNSSSLYKLERALRYTGSDRDALLQQMIKQGANPNSVLSSSNVVFKRGAESRVIELILGADIDGSNLNFILDNNYLNAEGKEKALAYLIKNYWEKDEDYDKAYAEACSLANVTPPYQTPVDRRLKQMKALIKAGTELNHFTQYGESGSWYSFSEGRGSYDDFGGSSGAFQKQNFTPSGWPAWLHTFNSTYGNLDNWIAMQNAVLDRANQLARSYVFTLAGICVASGNDRLNQLIARIINAGFDPKSKEILWDKNYYSMISLAKEKNPSLVDFIKNTKRGPTTFK